MKRWMTFAAIGLIAAVGGGWLWIRSAGGAASYRTAKVERGEILVTVTATGTIQPVNQVSVGTQVSGTIEKLLADFNSRVKAHAVVAQIDPAPFKAKVDQDRANLMRAQADVERVKASLVQAQKDLTRARELAKRELISASELDAAIAAADSLVAQQKVAEATVAQSQSALQISEVNLGYTTIVSPIDGIVISRNVDVGQTVAASLQAPTLFVIADSLKTVQVQASVAEADIGRITVGQTVTFTVDAYRERPFTGKVSQIRLAPTTVQNVVTYTVLIDAENPDEKLLPGMTASASFLVARHEGVLKIPNAALRFIPPSELAGAEPQADKAEKDKGPDKEKDAGAGRGGPRSGERPAGANRGRSARGRVWVRTPDGGIQAVSVALGATDGTFTQILRDSLTEGQEVVMGLVSNNADAAFSNPFGPQQRRR